MKRILILMLAVSVLFTSGCSVRVDSGAFNIPSDKIDSIEFQKDYIDDEGNVTYRKKIIEDEEAFEELCEMVRGLDVVRVSNEETPSIQGFPMVIIFRGKKDHYLVINQHVVFYDSIAYLYTDSDVYDSFENFYFELSEKEVDTELEWG